MNLVNIGVYAEGYYSGSSYSENVLIKEESYEKIKADIPEEIFCGELDGKHSQVYGEVEVELYKEGDLLTYTNEDCDGDTLKYEIVDVFKKYNIDFGKESNEIEAYLSSLDRYCDMTIRVKKSKLDKVSKIVDALIDII